jgi:hypothetical protein
MPLMPLTRRSWKRTRKVILRQPCCRTSGEPSSEGLDLRDSRTALGSLRNGPPIPSLTVDGRVDRTMNLAELFVAIKY